jgi:homoserine dehydrogenase
MVVEAIGGTSTAYSAILNSAAKGKHVVTANKELLALHLPIIESLFQHPHGPRLGFEAAVGGGIPIIRSLQQSLFLDSLTNLSGILNGTTNYMLSNMQEKKAAYQSILKEAQENGFCEADPTADVEGLDARNKLVLLARLAYGVQVAPSQIYTKGITAVSSSHFDIAQSLGFSIKLVCLAQKPTKETSLIGMMVCPSFVEIGSPLASTSSFMNMIALDTETCPSLYFHGPGAGRFATANSVVADMVNIALDTQARTPFPKLIDAASYKPGEVSTTCCVITSNKEDIQLIVASTNAKVTSTTSQYAILQGSSAQKIEMVISANSIKANVYPML